MHLQVELAKVRKRRLSQEVQLVDATVQVLHIGEQATQRGTPLSKYPLMQLHAEGAVEAKALKRVELQTVQPLAKLL